MPASSYNSAHDQRTLGSDRNHDSIPYVVRTLGEIFRLRNIHGTNFSAAIAMPHVGGALIAGCSCWVGVTLYFFRRYTLSAWIALAAVVILLAYKIAVIGW
jgi:hypothetical protein